MTSRRNYRPSYAPDIAGPDHDQTRGACWDNADAAYLFGVLIDTNGVPPNHAVEDVATMCSHCPIAATCIPANLKAGEKWAHDVAKYLAGRRRNRRQNPAPQATPEPEPDGPRKAARHGTDSGYHAHRRRWGTQPCDPCLAAHSYAQSTRTRRQKERAA